MEGHSPATVGQWRMVEATLAAGIVHRGSPHVNEGDKLERIEVCYAQLAQIQEE